MKKIKESIEVGGRELTIESGEIGKQASGSCVIRYGETVIFVAVTSSKGIEEDRGFFPMSVDYREKFYASGRIPGGFFKREARPSEREILASRLTDRPLRPLFPEGFNNETRVDITVMSYDEENEPDVLSALGASYALMISDIPFNGPIASIRVGRVNGELTINPSVEQLLESDMELILSGSDKSIVMVEGKCDFVSEEDVLDAIKFGHEEIKKIVEFQHKLVSMHKVVKREVALKEENTELISAIDSLIKDKVSSFNKPKTKDERYSQIDTFIAEIQLELAEEYPDFAKEIKNHIDHAISNDLRNQTINDKKRADGRDLVTVRDIDIETSLLPRVHGSSLFTRGETQAIVAATLGGKRDEQMMDNIEGLTYKRFLFHYNFPSYCVGEARGKFSLSRREIGHGNLAERAILPTLPSFEDFPYTIRIVSEITESNGSSSMASVCGSSLALMDAGVPIKSPIAGVAMGLVMDEDTGKYAILTDILGTEDHIGDMDFKVAGSEDGITAIQMDIKVVGLSYDILKDALSQAKDGRLHILSKMNESLDEHRNKLSIHAPKILQTSIPVDKIGEFIGPGGKNIKKTMETYDCEVNVDDDGSCTILGRDQDTLEAAKEFISSYSLVPKVGESYDGVVVKTLDFGAFVKIAPSVEGLVHVSEIDWSRTESVQDAISEGDEVKVKLIKIDDRTKKISFSIKALKPRPEKNPQ
jgi:polyribonucleotide nucleotidyltransferase